MSGSFVDINPDGEGFVVHVPGGAYQVRLLDAADGRLELLIDGRRLTAYVSSDGLDRWVTVDGRTHVLRKTSGPGRPGAAHDAAPDLSAPMPGQVRAVHVAAGDVVAKGQVLMVLEAMKMEIRIQAPFDGRILSVDTTIGQTVEREQVLVRMQRT